jgi:hypothetical protein
MQLSDLNFSWLNCLEPSYIHKNLLVQPHKLGMQVLVLMRMRLFPGDGQIGCFQYPLTSRYLHKLFKQRLMLLNTKQIVRTVKNSSLVCFNPVTTKQPL